MTPIVLIPARMNAARLPGKPLADICGKPMVVRVLRCALAAAMGRVIVAAGDQEIVDVVHGVGGEAILTDRALPSGSDRVLAALGAADPDRQCDVVVNLQGDMPFVAPDVIGACLDVLRRKHSCDIATLVAPEAAPADRINSNVVKAILAMEGDGQHGKALYFTRGELYGAGSVWRHVGIYAYRRPALEAFCAAPPSALEMRERLEQLRALELGQEIHAAVVGRAPLSVDTAADLAAARAFAAQAESAP